jgi:hypothetical protein
MWRHHYKTVKTTMGVTLYPKTQLDKWNFLRDVEVLKEDDGDGDFISSSSSKYFYENVLEKSYSTQYSTWGLPLTILYNCEEETDTFNRDDRGYIPPHILKRIVESKRFNEEYKNLINIYDEMEEDDTKYHFEISKIQHSIEILDFIKKNKENGISYD